MHDLEYDQLLITLGSTTNFYGLSGNPERKRFLESLTAQLASAGVSHVSEITDAEAPFTPRGCRFQAWSLGEYLRLDRVVLQDADQRETDSPSPITWSRNAADVPESNLHHA